MKVLLSEQGYVVSYALEGDLLDAVEAAEPADLSHFEEHFTAYRVRDGVLVFDDAQAAAEQAEAAKTAYRTAYRQRRQAECFSVINRGRLWYDALTEEQLSELKTWYRAWLDGTNTQTIPEKPEWLT